MQLFEIGDFRAAFRLGFKPSPTDEVFDMEISFIHMYMNPNLGVNRTNFHMNGFAIGLALKQRRKETRKLPIVASLCGTHISLHLLQPNLLRNHTW